MNDLIGRVVAFVTKKEPAAVIGAAVSILLAAQHEVAGAASWRDAVPALVALAVRTFVWSPASAQENAEKNYHLGVAIGSASVPTAAVRLAVGGDGSVYAPGWVGGGFTVAASPGSFEPVVRDEDPMTDYESPG